MDITVPINGVMLNVRVSILLETAKGYVFEGADNGFYFPLGGRIKINETSFDAAKRELYEELNIKTCDIKYIATLENFFTQDIPFHEINIIYYAKLEHIQCPKGFYYFNSSTIKDACIKPAVIKKMIVTNNFSEKHIIASD